MKKIAVLTSGGDAPGMNAAIGAVVRCALYKGMEVYGVIRGYDGLIDGDLIPLDKKYIANTVHFGGTFLKSARSDRFRTEEGLERAINVLKAYQIEGLVVIGGDGSLRGANELSKRGVRVMVLPGSIDNDLNYTDFTIGFDTAVNTVMDALSKLRDTSGSHDKVTVVEVMGRKCGDIALHSAVASRAEFVIIPEQEFEEEKLYRKLLESENKGEQNSIVIKAEGSKYKATKLIKMIKENTGIEARLVILSYLQRGGSPTYYDCMLAIRTAAKAVDLIYDEEDSKAIGIVAGEIIAVGLEEAINEPPKDKGNLPELAEILSS